MRGAVPAEVISSVIWSRIAVLIQVSRHACWRLQQSVKLQSKTWLHNVLLPRQRYLEERWPHQLAFVGSTPTAYLQPPIRDIVDTQWQANDWSPGAQAGCPPGQCDNQFGARATPSANHATINRLIPSRGEGECNQAQRPPTFFLVCFLNMNTSAPAFLASLFGSCRLV